jgi:AcrR family transcriptional regulator
VPRTRPSDTKARIQAVARELFARQGVQQTSLREIADRLGITKPALYYHFDSREALVRSIVAPFMEELEAFIVAREAGPRPEPRALLGDHFDLLFRHREILVMLVRDLSMLSELGLAVRMLEWRRRLIGLLLGPEPSLEDHIRSIVAIGGMSDCAVALPEVPIERIKPAAVDSACAALGLPPAPAPKPAPAPAPKPGPTPKPASAPAPKPVSATAQKPAPTPKPAPAPKPASSPSRRGGKPKHPRATSK